MATKRLARAVMAGLLLAATTRAAERGTIRLSSPPSADPAATAEGSAGAWTGPRRGFDYEAFQARLESLWFQRKALVVDGREADAAEQTRRIRAFCVEEGVGRLEHTAAALVVEARRCLRQGRHRAALEALDLARTFDPDRAQVDFAVAEVLWRQGERGPAVLSLGRGLRKATVASVRDLSLPPRVVLAVVVAWIACLGLFAVLMVVRYHRAFRHEVEEWVAHVIHERCAPAAGWAALLLPLLSWVGAGWIALYWLVVTFRYMSRLERLAAVGLIGAFALSLPIYGLAVSLYGTTTDPLVRTTLAAAGGEYSPDRILRVRQLIDARPEDPVYRFLLAGLYKNGRYFEEAFDEYQRALGLDPTMSQAHINVGNMFYTTGQYGEAIASYHRALEADPRSLLALFNLHLAQSEAFRFAEAEQSLARARALDSAALAHLFAESRRGAERATVLDASLETTSIWTAALGSGRVEPSPRPVAEPAQAAATFGDPLFALGTIGLVACVLSLLWTLRHPAARCCRGCGRAFCHLCKSGRQAGQEHCTQCTYAFVLDEGLAPDTKSLRLLETRRHARRQRLGRRLASLLLPGAGQVLHGRTLGGMALLVLWVSAWVVARPGWLGPLERASGLRIGLDLIEPRSVPAAFVVDPLVVLAFVLLGMTWLAANRPRLDRGEA